MKLTPEQIRSPLWQQLRKEYESQLVMLRRQNDMFCPENMTSERRGKIALLKELLRFDPDWSE